MELIKSSSEIIAYDSNVLKHIEKIARTCYKSEDKITDESAPKFVKMLYERGHHAMLEFYPFYLRVHKSIIYKTVYLNQLPEINGDFMFLDRGLEYYEASCNLRTAIMLNDYIELFGKVITNRYPELNEMFKFVIGSGNEDLIHLVTPDQSRMETLYLTGRFICDRGVSHELVRHRMCSFAQESTRYCNYGKGNVKFIIPTWLEEYNDTQDVPHSYLAWFDSMQDSEMYYKELIKEGWTPQQARSVLPNSLKTEIVIQARLSEWKHIFNLRCAKTAHPDMQALMIPFKEKVCAISNEYNTYFNS